MPRMLIVPFLTTLLTSGLALAQFEGGPTPNPQYVNVYWEVPGATKATWNSDVAAPRSNFSGTGPDSSMATVDFLDSYLQALLVSHYYNQLSQTFSAQPELPSIVVGQCGAPPNDLQTAYGAWPAFVNCVLNLPQYKAGGAENLSATNIILNVFVPPWVLPKDGIVNGALAMTTDLCSGHNGFNSNILNGKVQGHNATFIPTNSFAADGGSGIGCFATSTYLVSGGFNNVVRVLSHEIVEAATYGDYCDQCTTSPVQEDDFILESLNEFKDPANQNNCAPNEPVLVGALAPVTGFVACGSGPRAEIQAQFDPTRYTQPWDVTAGFGSSMYVGVENTTRGWGAGLSHYPNYQIPVQIAGQTWNNGLITIVGFTNTPGGGYSNRDAGPYFDEPGDSWSMTAYDPQWGKPSTTNSPVHGEWPHTVTLTNLSSPTLTLGHSINVLGQILGAPGCIAGAPALPMGDAIANVTFSDGTPALALNTDAAGNFRFTYTPRQAGTVGIFAATPISSTTDAGLWATALDVEVLPTITSIEPASGIISGRTPVDIYGTGFTSDMAVEFSSLANGSSIALAPPYDGTHATLDVPISNVAQTVNVSVVVGGVQSESTVQYAYAAAGHPVPSYLGGGCSELTMSIAAWDVNGASLNGQPVSVSAPSTQTLVPSDLVVGQAFEVWPGVTYNVQVQGYAPATQITVPANLYAPCVQAVWFPSSSLPFPSQVDVLNYSVLNNVDVWMWSDPSLGSFTLALDRLLSTQVASSIVAVVPTISYEESVIGGAEQMDINATATPTSIQLGGTLVNVTTVGQANVFHAGSTEAFLPATGALTFNLPSGSSYPPNQYRIVHSEEVGGAVVWRDMTTSFGSGTVIAAGLLDQGWYGLALLSAPLPLR